MVLFYTAAHINILNLKKSILEILTFGILNFEVKILKLGWYPEQVPIYLRFHIPPGPLKILKVARQESSLSPLG